MSEPSPAKIPAAHPMPRTRAAFEANFRDAGEVGAAFCVYHQGREVLHLCGGVSERDGSRLWTAETLAPVWSSTKGPAALTLLLALHESGLDLLTPVRAVWPELTLPIHFGQLLSHQSGLPVLDNPPSVFDYPAVIGALIHQAPAWSPGTAHGYHPRTSGFLLDECVRRLTGGTPLGQVWRERVAEPHGIDFWIGPVPESRWESVARMIPGRPKPPHPDEAAFFQAMADPASLTRRAFQSPAGLHAVSEMNQPTSWAAGLPAFGGVGSARGLAKFYSLLAHASHGADVAGIPAKILPWLETRQTNGPDRILLMPTAFSAGFMMDPLGEDGLPLRQRFGPSIRGFGQPGAGGSHAFADPENDVSFAYVMNQMEPGVLPNRKSLNLITAAYQDLGLIEDGVALA